MTPDDQSGDERISIARLNDMSRDEFVDAVGPVFEYAPWVASNAWDGRPFEDIGTLHDGMVQALKDGEIAGAGLDVFDQEPLAEDSELWQMENVIMSPHISGGTEIYNQRATGILCDNLRRYLAEEPLMNLADPKRGY